MRKIPSLFRRDWQQDVPALDEVHPACEWVFNENVPVVATRKWDGTCVRIDEDGNPWKRRSVDPGDQRPAHFVEDQRPDLVSVNDVHGWVPVQANDPNDQYHVEGYHNSGGSDLPAGTYELVGPKIQGNPEGVDSHRLIRHGLHVVKPCPISYVEVKSFLARNEIEGLVYYEIDGHRQAKAKRTDFGMEWPTP